MNNRISTALVCLLPVLLAAGCASEPTATERNFGDSVRSMVRAQVSDPSTLANPSEATVDSTDGQMLEGALEAYRLTVADPGAVGSEITINVGSGQ